MNLLHANDRDGQYPPSWYAATTDPLPPFPPLDTVRRADVVVVGGGYTGLSAALHLAQRGMQVVLLEAQRVGFGASGRNGGQVGSGQRLSQPALERMLGAGPARALWDIAEEAKALVQGLIAEHAIAADWQPGIAHACRNAAEVRAAQDEAAHLARTCGYDRIEPLDRDALAALLGTRRYAGGVLDHGAGHIQPLAFALGLARAAAAAGVAIHEGSEVTMIAEGRPVTAHAGAGSVTADHLILACNGYLGRLDRGVAARVMPINNFIIATEPLGGRAPMARPVAAADTRFVVNYWRQTRDGRLLFGGGETHGYRFPADIAALVRKPMLAVYPDLADARIDHAWGGTLAITMTRAPAFLRLSPTVLSASGYSGHGVAMATMAGRIMAEAVAGQAGRFDLMARLPVPVFPGGLRLRAPLLALAMTWYALRDRLGV
jgi:gamma-glutamylputrescine oxidase